MPDFSELDTGRVTHDPQMHRHVQWKAPVRVATTANGTFATAFDVGSVIDGETLVEFDRILIKNQTDAENNGIYEVQASGVPQRVYDMEFPNEFPGAVAYVMEGTANAGKLFVCTNLTDPDMDTDDIDFAELSGGGGSALIIEDEGTPLATAATTLDFVGAGVTATGATGDKTITIPGGISGITVQDEGSPLTTAATTLDFVGAGVTATGAGATKTITIPAGGTVAIVLIVGDGGSTIPTGICADMSLPFGCTITGWRLLADQAGDIVMDTWVDDYAAYPPDVTDSIWGGSEPEITTGNIKGEATGLSIAVVAGDTLRFNTISCTDIERVTLTITATRT